MAALRIVFLVLAVGVLGLLGWRAVEPRAVPGAPSPSRSLAPTAASPTPAMTALDRAMRDPPAPMAAQMPAPVLATAPASVPAALVDPNAAPRTAEAPPAAPRDRSGEAPEFLGFYGRLRTDFPRHYAAVSARDRAVPPDAAVWDAMRDLEQSEGVLAAQAEPAALDRFFDARSAVLSGLAPLDAHRCVDFLYGVTDAGIADFTAAHRGLVASLADRTLEAIADGRVRHVDRPSPTASDLDALSTGLAAFGLAPAEIGLLIDGTTPDPPLPDRRVCEIGRTYLDVLHGLPADARERIYGLAAQLLARS